MLRNFVVSIFILNVCVACSSASLENYFANFDTLVDSSQIPATAIYSRDTNLVLINGVYFYKRIPFSGHVREFYDSKIMKADNSYLNGKLHGISRTYYGTGQLRDSRCYKENLAYGRHYGYWDNGNMKFDFLYRNDKMEGVQKQWYQSGRPYTALTFQNDTESGMQKAWRENGKLYINYEVKNGKRYGLQKSALCYTLRDGKLK
jgi:antitoxin component YwqK of YwqJK toxin-antitoxin module